MAFDFHCPQGHLLRGEESQSGQQFKCPYCESEFLVPNSPELPQAVAPPTPPPAGPTGRFDFLQPEEYGEEEEEGEMAVEPPLAPPGQQQEIFADDGTGAGLGDALPDPEAPFGLFDQQEERLFHILCPGGHELETTREMFGQHMACPWCQAEFLIRYQDTQEGRQKEAQRQQIRDQKTGATWLNWAIVMAVVVVAGLIALIATAVSN